MGRKIVLNDSYLPTFASYGGGDGMVLITPIFMGMNLFLRIRWIMSLHHAMNSAMPEASNTIAKTLPPLPILHVS